ncbi:hypothetical protein ACIBAH_35435 [Streptomyces sp. NPDC051445]|uniref:hypothetical protein n=1 Tax=Streptomyces sp. NPDC051445 TaxID=3365653 RepID=UPI0037A28001
MRGNLLRAFGKIFLLVALLGLALPAAGASASAQVIHRRTEVLALSGTFASAVEPVTLTGRIRVSVTTRTNPGGGGTATITSQLINTTGIGQDSGRRYRYIGADRTVVAWPPGPVIPLAVFPTFLEFFPPDPIVPPHPIKPVTVLTTVLADGSIDSISATVGRLIENPDN